MPEQIQEESSRETAALDYSAVTPFQHRLSGWYQFLLWCAVPGLITEHLQSDNPSISGPPVDLEYPESKSPRFVLDSC